MKEERDKLIKDESQPEPTRLLVIWGYVAAFVSAVAFAASGGFSQALGGYVPAFELNLWRFGTQAVLAGVFIVLLKLDIRIPKDKISWLLLLCLAYNAHNTAFYESSIYLPVTEMICLNNVIPLPIIFLLTLLLYKRCSWCELLAIGVCITGILLVTQPRGVFPGSPTLPDPQLICRRLSDDDVSVNLSIAENVTLANTTFADLTNASTRVKTLSKLSVKLTKAASNELLGDILAGSSAVFLVIRIFVTNKKLPGFNPVVVAFWVATSGVVLSSILMATFEAPTFPQRSTCQLLLFGHSLTASIAALIGTVGELNIPPTMFTLIVSSETLILLGAQHTVLKSINPGRGNILETIGGILVFIGTVVGPMYSLFKENRKTDGSLV